MRGLQDYIHHFEEGAGKNWGRFGALCLAILVVALAYNSFHSSDLPTREGMDYAQVARNIAQGNGFSTLFVRPLSLALVQRQAVSQGPWSGPLDNSDPAKLNPTHPDIAHAPLYPLLLAGLMKVLPFDFHIDLERQFWSAKGSTTSSDPEKGTGGRIFRRYQPDFLICIFNQCILLAVATASFLLARRVFDQTIAVVSTVLLLGTDLQWRFSASGLPTLLLQLVFLGLVWCLLKLNDQLETSETPELRTGRCSNSSLAVVAGVLLGLGAMTQYSFGLMILPVLGFYWLVSGSRRAAVTLTALSSFLVIVAPWLVRNYMVCGHLFGTAGYAVLEGTDWFPGDLLQRSLGAGTNLPVFDQLKVGCHKLILNSLRLLQNDLPRLGGTWLSGFFLVGLVIPVGTARSKRLGWFVASSVTVLAIVQILGRTTLSEDSPDVNSENLLVLLLPMIWIYGTKFFFLLLDQVEWYGGFLRTVFVAGFVILTCLAMPLSLVATRRSRSAFSPPYPPWIQAATSFVKKDEVMMSDVPWAVAWYGRAQ